ncbi:Ribonuclease 3 [Spathaspora sp. JA1]|nr:Ribonuclease 3 [Spathaspora sp. JA1]
MGEVENLEASPSRSKKRSRSPSDLDAFNRPPAKSPTFDREIPQSVAFVDLQKLEYATRTLQKNIETVLGLSPDVLRLKKLIDSPNLTQSIKMELKQNELIEMAAKLQSRYKIGTLPILDEIIVGEINFNDQDMKKLKEYHPNTRNIEIEVPVRPMTDEISPRGLDNSLPPLPEIKDPALYERVFIHKSYVNSKSYLNAEKLINTHNERLEFIGDSILNTLCTMIIYKEFPTATEGQLSQIRSDLVNNKTLCQFSLQYGLDKKLRARIEDAVLKSGDQKIYADIFEAYIGAVATERGMNLSEVKSWLHKLYKERLRKLRVLYISEPIDREAKSKLYSTIGMADASPVYETIQQGDGVKVDCIVHCKMKGEIIGVGQAPSSKDASLRAAMDALRNKEKLEKFYLQRKMTDRPVKGSKESTPTTSLVNSAFDMSLFPIKADDSEPIDTTATNTLYAEINQKTGTHPQYIFTKGDDNKQVVSLKVRGIEVAIASDSSKKNAMRRVAKALLDNKKAFDEICKSI